MSQHSRFLQNANRLRYKTSHVFTHSSSSFVVFFLAFALLAVFGKCTFTAETRLLNSTQACRISEVTLVYTDLHSGFCNP